MARRPVGGRGVGSDPARFVDSLSPDLLAGIRRRIRWTAALQGVSLQEDSAEDLTQDLLLRLWERGVPSEVENFPAYALRAASNLTVDALRRSRSKKRTSPTDTTDEGAVLGAPWPLTPEQIAIGRDSLRHELAECRRLLSARQYQLFALIYLAGFSPREVSKRVGLSSGNVHALLASLRRALRGGGVVLRPRAARSELI